MSWPDCLKKRHFTDTAVLIVRHINARANARGLYVLDDAAIPMLALWTVIRWERKLGLVALETMGVDLPALTGQLDRLLDQKADENPVAGKNGILVYRESGKPVPRRDWQSMLEPLLGRAEQEAAEMGHGWVGSEHLLLAVIRMADSKLSSLLDQHLVAHEKVKQTVLELLAT